MSPEERRCLHDLCSVEGLDYLDIESGKWIQIPGLSVVLLLDARTSSKGYATREIDAKGYPKFMNESKMLIHSEEHP